MASQGDDRGEWRLANLTTLTHPFTSSKFGSSRGGFARGGGRGGVGGHKKASPDYVVELGFVMHLCEGELVCRCTNEKVPSFNALVFLENKTLIGKVDEIFGPVNEGVRALPAAAAEPVQATTFAETRALAHVASPPAVVYH